MRKSFNRKSFKLAIGIGALAGVVSFSAAASADPYFNRYTDGSWTNAEYSDCSGIAIGPNGEAVVMPPPVALVPY